MRIHQKQILIFCVVAFFLISCGFSTPSESDARAIFEKKYEKDIKDGTVKITKFKKVDGQSAEIAGVKLYGLKYEAEIEYPKGLHPECKNPAPTDFSCGFYYKFKEKGEKEKFSGEINFEKTENGWQVRDSRF